MNPISVLYVDDEPALLDLTRLYLGRGGGIAIETSISAADAISLLANRKFDVIVSDYQMPEMDGIAFLKYVREHVGSLPFILFTGRGREEVVIQALENGADFYLQKGGDPKSQFAELRNKIEKAAGEYRALSAREDAEQRLFDIINFLPDAAVAIDREGKVILWNRAMEEMTGVPAGQILGKGGYEYALPFYGERRPMLIDLIFSSPEEIREKYSHIVRNGPMLTADTSIPRLQGKPRILWAKASPLYDPQGAVAGAIEVVRDITDRQETEEALRESEEKFREMADLMPQIIYEADTTGRLTYANAIAFQWFGYTEEEFARGLKVADMIVPEDRNRGLRTLGGILAGEKPPAEGQEYLARRKDGSTFPVTIYTVPILRGGQVVGLRGIIVDVSGRKQAEENARERERVLTTLIANLPGFVYRCRNDRNWTMTYISSGCQDMTGYAPQDFLGTKTVSYNDIIHPDYREQVWQNWQAALDKKQVYEGEYPIVNRNGETRWVWERGLGIYSEDGRLLFLEGFITDVSRRKRTEEALAKKTAELEKKSRYYELLLRTSTDPIYVLDPEGRLREWNNAFLSHLGYSPEEAAGLTVADWNAEWSEDQLRERILRVLREGGRFETLHRRKDGSIRQVEITGDAVVIEGEKLLYASARDITDRKTTENALKKSQEQLALAIEGSGAGLWDWNIRAGTVMYNERWANIAGYTLAELEPVSFATWESLCHPDDLKRSELLIREHFAGTAPYELEVRMRHKDGHWVWVLNRGKVVEWDDEHRPARMIGTHLDITALKRMEGALRQANTKLNLLNSITRHDIRNQLTALKGYLSISRSRLADPVRMEEFIDKEERIATTMERQITFTGYYQDMGIREPVWQNVEATIRRGAALLPLGRVVLQIDGADLEVYADPLFEKVFYNLVDNAIRYGGEGLSAIRVHSRETGDGLVLTWEDNGAGISDGDRNHLFERGFGKNTGLGLFLAREILGITGISIRETGVHGTGARFEMLVPKGMYRFVKP